MVASRSEKEGSVFLAFNIYIKRCWQLVCLPDLIENGSCVESFFFLRYVKRQNEYGTKLTALPWRSLLLYFLAEFRVEGGKYFPREKLISCVICVPMSSWSLGPLNKDACLMVHLLEIVLWLFSLGRPGLQGWALLSPNTRRSCFILEVRISRICAYCLSGVLMGCSSSNVVFVQKCFIYRVCYLPGSSTFMK